MQHPPVTITWIGHATVLIDIDGFRILTDPIVTSRVAHLRRRVDLPVLEHIDVVLLSHLHMDHLHLRSLREVVGANTGVVLPTGGVSLLRSLPAASTREVVAGDVELMRSEHAGTPEITVEATPADHSNRRGPHSRLVAEPVGYVIRCGALSVYFAGDTDLFDEMRTLGAIDVALIPIWGWGPTLGERHLDPERAATAVQWIDPVRVIPIHWGTYTPITPRPGAPAWIENPLAEFRFALEGVGLGDRLTALRPGAQLDL